MIQKKRKQFAFDIDPELHKEVKILAAQRNISINLWMTRAILARLYKDKNEPTNNDMQ